MKIFKFIDIGIQTFLTLYIIYILVYRFTINWDFILAFWGLGILMIWQMISYFILLKKQGKAPQRIYYIVGIIVLISISSYCINHKSDLYIKLFFIGASTLAAYYYAISIIDIFIISKNK
jgi:hypothetical protein